jgi:uncharacterized protein (DUF1697 family)
VTVFVGLLRGINVGRHRRVAMTDVRAALAEAGYDDVTTHLQSGNLIVASGARRPETIERSIGEALQTALGLEVDVIVRTASGLAKIARDNPLLGRDVDPQTLHVAFLKARPTATAARALTGADFGREEFVLRGAEIYLRYPNGLGRSKMTTAFFERALHTPATVRNWKVVTTLVELATTAGPRTRRVSP